jgi:hypothetical protein
MPTNITARIRRSGDSRTFSRCLESHATSVFYTERELHGISTSTRAMQSPATVHAFTEVHNYLAHAFVHGPDHLSRFVESGKWALGAIGVG